jgi:hypothetical protein
MIKRVKIWWMPKAEAKAIIRHAIIIDNEVVQCSKRKKSNFIRSSLCLKEKRPPVFELVGHYKELQIT